MLILSSCKFVDVSRKTNHLLMASKVCCSELRGNRKGGGQNNQVTDINLAHKREVLIYMNGFENVNETSGSFQLG